MIGLYPPLPLELHIRDETSIDMMTTIIVRFALDLKVQEAQDLPQYFRITHLFTAQVYICKILSHLLERSRCNEHMRFTISTFVMTTTITYRSFVSHTDKVLRKIASFRHSDNVEAGAILARETCVFRLTHFTAGVMSGEGTNLFRHTVG